MSSQRFTLLLLLAGLFCFDLLFWEQSAGINLILFSSILLTYSLRNESFRQLKEEVFLGLTATLISGFMVIWNNSSLSIIVHILSVLLCIGLIKQNHLHSVFEGPFAFVVSYLSMPFSWLKSMTEKRKSNPRLAFILSFVKLFVLPLVLFFLFFIIYRNASPKFEELTQSISVWIGDILSILSFGRIFFILFGCSLLASALYKGGYKMENLVSGQMQLTRKRIKKNRLPNPNNLYHDLVSEYKMAILVFALLNALLLVVNILDIDWIWFGFEVPLEFNLKQFVYAGTTLLIFSILLSIAIFLYFFRNSLNFYPNNKVLLFLGKLWIFQNGILAVSVFLRNYHYINYHGLAGKRIGVIIFLAMVLFGLATLIIKVNKKKTFGYLIRKNSVFVLLTLALMSCLNWDRLILNYNLTHHNSGEIDVDYYLELSPTVTPVILNNLDTIEHQMLAHQQRVNKEIYVNHLDIDLFRQHLEYKTAKYMQERLTEDWPSWNRQDYLLMRKVKLSEEGQISAK